jgi:hypothetical protein
VCGGREQGNKETRGAKLEQKDEVKRLRGQEWKEGCVVKKYLREGENERASREKGQQPKKAKTKRERAE